MRLFAFLVALGLALPALAIDDVTPKKPLKDSEKKEKAEKKKKGERDYEESKYISPDPYAGKSQYRFNSEGDAILSEKAQKRLAEEAKKKKDAAKKAEKAAAKAEKAAAKEGKTDAEASEKKAKKPKKKVVKKTLQKKKSFGDQDAAEGGAEGIDPALAAQAAAAAGAGGIPAGILPGAGGDGNDAGD